MVYSGIDAGILNVTRRLMPLRPAIGIFYDLCADMPYWYTFTVFFVKLNVVSYWLVKLPATEMPMLLL